MRALVAVAVLLAVCVSGLTVRQQQAVNFPKMFAVNASCAANISIVEKEIEMLPAEIKTAIAACKNATKSKWETCGDDVTAVVSTLSTAADDAAKALDACGKSGKDANCAAAVGVVGTELSATADELIKAIPLCKSGLGHEQQCLDAIFKTLGDLGKLKTDITDAKDICEGKKIGAGSFIQSTCPTDTCDSKCTNTSLPTGKCLQTVTFGSAVAHCTPTELVQTMYNESNDCSGPSTEQKISLEACHRTENGQFFENFCPDEVPIPPSPPTPYPPTPAPAVVIQKICGSSNCTEACENQTFPTGQCIQTGQHASVILTCDTEFIIEQAYQTHNCQEQYQLGQIPLDQCAFSQKAIGFVENLCSNSAPTAPSKDGKKYISLRK